MRRRESSRHSIRGVFWVTTCLPSPPPGPGLLQFLLLDELIRAQAAAAGPLATYNKLLWLFMHLGAPIVLDNIARPVKQPGDDGEVKELEQAPALPPDLLMMLEHIAAAMITEDSWDSVAVCVALSLAWSLMRLVHVNRSRITHYSEDSLWCRAFRGKGK